MTPEWVGAIVALFVFLGVVAGWIWDASNKATRLKFLEKALEDLGVSLHKYNKHFQQVINDMRTDEIIPMIEAVKTLSKSDQESKDSVSKINTSFSKIYDLIHEMDKHVALLTQSKK